MGESENESEQQNIRKEQPLYLAFLTVLGVAAVNVYRARYFKMTGPKMLPWYLASATIYISGRIADKVSTIRMLDTITRSGKAGFNPNLIEMNSNLPAELTRDQYTRLYRRKNIIDSCFLAAGVIFPPNAIALGIGSFLATIHNEKLRVKIEKEMISPKYSAHE